MKALVYHGPGNKALEDRPKPVIGAPTDAIVKIVKTTICGTDLHILKGDVPTCVSGRILGHEGIGMVTRSAALSLCFTPAIELSCHASRRAENATIAAAACIRIASMAAGSSAIRSTAPRPNMSVSHSPIPVSITSPQVPMKTPLSC